MQRKTAVIAGVGGVVVTTTLAALLLGGDPAPETLAPSVAGPPPGAGPAPVPPLEPPQVSPDVPSAPPTDAAPSPGPAPAAPPAAPTSSGAALVEQVRAIVRRGEAAGDAAAEQAAARDLSRVLADLAARGEAALPDARLLTAPGEPAGVQEVGVRVLAGIGSAPALEALADLARGQAPGPARLQALRALRASPLAFARGALLDVALDRGADLEVRSYALDLMRDLVGAEATLHDVAADAQEPPALRAVALDALLALEPARGRAALAELEGDEALRPWLEALRSR